MSASTCTCAGVPLIVAGEPITLMPWVSNGRCADCGLGRTCKTCGESQVNARHRETYGLIMDGAVTALFAGGGPADVPAPMTCPDALSAEWRTALDGARERLHAAGWAGRR